MKTKRGYTKRIDDTHRYSRMDYTEITLTQTTHFTMYEQYDIMEEREYQCIETNNMQLEDYEATRFWNGLE